MKKILSLLALSLLAVLSVWAQENVQKVEVQVPGTLSDLVNDLETERIKSLTISGGLNAADIVYLRSGVGKLASVEMLDLTDVTLIPGDEPYAALQVARSGEGMGTTTNYYYIGDTYSIETDQALTGLGGYRISNFIHTNDLSGAFSFNGWSSDPPVPFKTITLPAALPQIGSYMFANNKVIEHVTLPDNVNLIGEKAFYRTSSLKEIMLPNYIKIIEHEAFRDSEIAHVNIPATLRSIGDYAFSGTNISGEYDFSNVEELGKGAFSDVKLTGTLNLGKLKVIPDEAFDGGLYDKLILSDGVESIGANAFCGSALAEVNIPTSLISIYANSFANTPWFKSLTAEDGIIYINDIAVQPTADIKLENGLLTIKEGTRAIANYSWSGWSWSGWGSICNPVNNLVTGLKLPSTLEFIGDGVFCNLNIEDVQLPSGLRHIGAGAFADCASLWFDDLPETVEFIGDEAFKGCGKLTSVTIGENVNHLGKGAFSKCIGISSVKILATHLAELNYSGYPFENAKGLDKIFIGAKVEVLPWHLFSITNASPRKIEFEQRDSSTPLVIGMECFSSIGDADFVNFPQRIDSIGEGAFRGCNVPAHLEFTECTYIGASAFYGCASIETLTLPPMLTTLVGGAFGSCEHLKRVEYNCVSAESVSDGRGQWAIFGPFNGCLSLAEVRVAKNVAKLGFRLFYGCKNLMNITFEANEVDDTSTLPMTFEIGETCFWGCPLSEITLPCNTSCIGDAAFEYTGIKSLIIPASIHYIGKHVFFGSQIKDITILADEVPEIGGNLWYDDYQGWQEAENATFHVPAALIDNYRTADVWKDYRYMTIEKLVESISLSESDITLEKGQNLQLTADIKPVDADNRTLTWVSDNETVAVVDTEGNVTALTPGIALITATTTDGSNLSASCLVTVVPGGNAIEETDADTNDGETRYYNLQGIRVDKLTPGVYLKVQGTKTSKVIVKE